MNLYRFIDSKDIRDHLQEIDYHFSASEAAYLVWQCETVTLDKKIAAWEEIIRTMPDCTMEIQSTNMPVFESFHNFLQSYVELQYKKLKMFFEEEKDTLYYFEPAEIDSPSRGNNAYSTAYYATFDECAEVFRKIFADKKQSRVQFVRKWLRYEHKKMYLIMDYDMSFYELELVCESDDRFSGMDNTPTPLLTDDEKKIDQAFFYMNFSFPTPFKRGDIVGQYNANDYYQFYVFSYIRDEIPYGYFLSYSGEKISYASFICSNYLTYEKKSIEDLSSNGGKMLVAISQFLRGEINIADFSEIYRKNLLKTFLMEPIERWRLG